MGAVSSALGGGKEAPSVFLNFDNVKPSSQEQEIYDEVGKVLNKTKTHIADLQNYKGCGELIRKALTTPGKETEAAAWDAVLPCVDAQKAFYDFSLELEGVVGKLFKAIVAVGPANLEGSQALCYQMAVLFDFVLQFDEVKMGCPHLQNDFSYYRRTINRLKLAKDDPSVRMRDEVANKVSLFFAYPSPMVKTMVEATKVACEDRTVARDPLCDILALFANICEGMVERRLVTREDGIAFTLRSMCGSIVLYDHIHPLGCFHKKSPVLIRKCILTLKKQQKPQTALLNALKYTTIHFNDV